MRGCTAGSVEFFIEGFLGYSVSGYFEYPCPDCRTTSTLHGTDCRFSSITRSGIEKAYIDILACVSQQPVGEQDLREQVHGNWDPQYAATLNTLKREHRVRESDSGIIELRTPSDRKEHVKEPSHEPMRTLYQEGSVPGCHDNAVFAMIAWYEMVGFSWDETRAYVIDWLRESGAWERGGFEESSPEDVVDKKRHVFDEGYGWRQAAEEAKAVIDRQS